MSQTRPYLAQKAINYLKHLPLAHLASFYFRFPALKLKIIGVTGTDGKTTTVNLLYHVLREAGLPVAMICTVSAKIREEEIDTGFHVTAPDPWLLQKLLAQMTRAGVKYLVLEVTSHGLDQFRLFGLGYEVGVLTNITHEHLDYHKSFENYRKAKLKMLLKSKTVVLNRDDESYWYLVAKLQSPVPGGSGQRSKVARIFSYGIKNSADVTPNTFSFKTSLPGEYNQYNCLAVIAAATGLGIAPEVIRKAIASFKGVTGRMEEIAEGQNFRAIVDFAHTPNALKQVLETLKGQLKDKGKLIVVFGAAGERDKEKRPMMGEVAGRLADLIVLTAEDPRTEKAEDICQQIASGALRAGAEELSPTKGIAIASEFVGGKNKFVVIPDRQEAIDFTIKKLAKKNDIIVVCGKGHEKSMCFGKTEYPWSDQEAVRKSLQNGGKI